MLQYYLSKGTSSKAISTRLGHSTIQITMDLYTHLYENMNRKVANQVNHFLKINPFYWISKNTIYTKIREFGN